VNYSTLIQSLVQKASCIPRTVLSIKPIKFKTVSQASEWKPQGLWYAQGGEWLEWMKSDRPEWLDKYNFMYALEIHEPKILMISSIEKFEQFEKEYFQPDVKRSDLTDPGRYSFIDWPRIEKEYSGVEIIPYFWEKRLANLWYYGWDVAAGCIWHENGVQKLTEIWRRK